MQVASRPRFTAGVALVGASLVVASTVAPVPDVHVPDLHLPAIRSMDVDLAAAVNPLAIYSQVLHDALANVSTLAENAKPGEVLQAILSNQLGNLTTVGGAIGTSLTTQVPQLVESAVAQLAAGNVAGAANSLVQIPLAVGLPLLPALLNPLQSVANVINAFTSDSLGTELILAGFVAPLISTPAAAATAIQNVIGAVATGNPAAVVGALLGAPATVADGLLNGGYGPDLAPLTGLAGVIVKAGGLLSSSNLNIDGNGNIVVGTGGPIAALEQVLNKITGALAPKATAAVKTTDVATVPPTAATTVTLSTGGAAASIPAKATKDTSTNSTSAESSSATKDSTTKPESTAASVDTKSTEKDADATTGNKVQAKLSAGSATTKPDAEAADSTTTADKATGGKTSTPKHAKRAKHAK